MWSSCRECFFLCARARRWNSLAMQWNMQEEVCSTRGEILWSSCSFAAISRFSFHLLIICFLIWYVLSSIPFECLPSVHMWPKIQKLKNAKMQIYKNIENTIPPECRYALVEWIVPSEVWDHHSVLPCLCRKHLDYKKNYMRCSTSNCQWHDDQQYQTIRKHSVS